MKTEYESTDAEEGQGSVVQAVYALVLVWSRDEPQRVGEVFILPPGTSSIGRADPSSGWSPLPLVQQRPGQNRQTGPFRSPKVSRRQLDVTVLGDDITVHNKGRVSMSIAGREGRSLAVKPGDLIEVERRFSLLCVRRPSVLPGLPTSTHPFGGPDAHGLVGESEAAWSLRAQLDFVAPRSAHVLVLGESGTGKELAARAVHAGSRLAAGPFVSRSAATIPEGLVDAELFGNSRNYPNQGTPARPGLVGEAHRGTLFLDEIGEMPHGSQAHLLRVLDQGEFSRLGEAQPRTVQFRLVAATNRSPAALKHDFAARMPIRVSMPTLAARRDDLPLLARHLLRALARKDPDLARRFFEADEPLLSQGLVRQLVARPWSTHVRELQSVLWESMMQSPGRRLVPLGGATHTEEPSRGIAAVPVVPTPDTEPSREALAAALAEAEGNKTRAAAALGLRNRYQLLRLLKKHGLR